MYHVHVVVSCSVGLRSVEVFPINSELFVLSVNSTHFSFQFVAFLLSECSESDKAALAITKAVSRVLQHNTFGGLLMIVDSPF